MPGASAVSHAGQLMWLKFVAVALLFLTPGCAQAALPTPTPSSAEPSGLPVGWTPARELTGDVWIREDHAVLEDVRVVSGTIYVAAKDVTLRRIEGIGATVNNIAGPSCGSGLLIEDSTFRRGDLGSRRSGEALIGDGGYTVRNVVIDGATEGLRVGEGADCGGVTVENTFIRIQPPDTCGDWHGDGIQGYYGGKLVIRNSTIVFQETAACGGTAAFFYPSGQGNTSVDIDGLLVSGGGYPFRLGTRGSVVNLQVVEGSWGFAPVDVPDCSLLSRWQASIVKLDKDGRPTHARDLPCPG